MTNTIKIKPEMVEKLQDFFNSNNTYKKSMNSQSISMNVSKMNMEYFNKMIIEKYTQKTSKVKEFLERNVILKEFFSSTFLIALMQIVIFVVMASFGIIPPMYMDFVGLKMTVYIAISAAGYFFKKYLFPNKGEFYKSLILTFFFSSIYQINGFLIY